MRTACVVLSAAGVWAGTLGNAEGALVAYWSFNGQNTAATAVAGNGVTATADAGSGTMSLAGPTSGTNFIWSNEGSSLNLPDGYAGGVAARLQRGERWNNGTATFSFSTASGTLEDADFTFAASASTSSVNAYQASYSTDGGGTWTNIGSPGSFATGYALYSVDLGDALDGLTSAAVRLTFSGGPGGSNTGTANRLLLDNVQITAVPEPGSMAGLALGAIAMTRRRR